MAGIVITGTNTEGVVLSNPATDDPATITATAKARLRASPLSLAAALGQLDDRR